MECCTSIAEEIGKDAVKNCIKDVYSYIKNYNTFLSQLKAKHQQLQRKKDDINHKVEMGESKLEKITNETEGWLQNVQILIDDEDVRNLMDENFIKRKDECCFGHFSCNFYCRYEMSRLAKAKADEMEAKISECPQDPVTLPVRASKMELEDIPTEHSKRLESRERLRLRVLEMLTDDQVGAVGICGTGGVGKTTLANEVVNNGAKNIFDLVIMVEISEDVNLERVQNEIAAQIGMSFDVNLPVGERAKRLYNALKNVKPKRNEGDQPTKILIIMDNIWTELNLRAIGIPHNNAPPYCCKVLFTSRERRACRSMNVQDINILDLSMLNEDEARCLFHEGVGNLIDIEANRKMEDRLLITGGGLPLAISALAKMLKTEDLEWCEVVEELEKPISCRNDDAHHQTYAILEKSYKVMRDSGKKMFFLLACLFPPGSSISVNDLMRYGIGLGLFECVISLTDAIRQARRWAKELKSSSLLLEDDIEQNFKGQVKVHDTWEYGREKNFIGQVKVRASAISFSKTDGQRFMVEGIPWLMNETCDDTYTAISMMKGEDYGRLKGVSFNKLGMLLLRNARNTYSECIPKLDDGFFEGMMNLKIMVLLGMDFNGKHRLPRSITRLRYLRVLDLEDCFIHDENFELITELVDLVVLSLRGTNIWRIPYGIMKLSKLRLLDLTLCGKLKSIAANVIGSLTRLEGLYMWECGYKSWRNIDEDDGDEASLEELSSLGCLKVLELQTLKIKQWPTNQEFIRSLETFKIDVAENSLRKLMIFPPKIGSRRKVSYFSQLSSSLMLNRISWESVCGCKWLQLLLTKTNYLALNGINGLKNVVPYLDTEGFQNLETLRVSYLSDLQRICDARTPPGMFSNLRHLFLSELKNLEYVLPTDVARNCRNLTSLEVRHCGNLNFIWSGVSPVQLAAEEDNKKGVIQFPSLKAIKLTMLRKLLTMLDKAEVSSTVAVPQTLLDTKIEFPSLEELEVGYSGRFVKLWDFPDPVLEERCTRIDEHGFSLEATLSRSNITLPSFQNLKSMTISSAHSLETLGGCSIAATLVRLEYLLISCCDMMKEVISQEAYETQISSKIIAFPKLKFLQLHTLDNLECFYGGSYQLQFPALESLLLTWVRSMKRFVGEETSTAFFPQMEFPCLKWFSLKGFSLKPEVEEELRLLMKDNPGTSYTEI